MGVQAAEGEKTVEELREEIAELKRWLAKAQEQSVTNFSASVELRSRYEAAVQRINEANDVAKKWRSQAINLKHELSYTKAIAQSVKTVDLEKVYASSARPRFRISNIAFRQPDPRTSAVNGGEEPVVRQVPHQPIGDGVAPSYISMR